MSQKQSGFTLIEIAIVLVIIGLLLGGVLKGEELITSARVRNLISQQDGVKAAFFGFQDRYGALPGDYPGAFANIAGISTAACGSGVGNGNGRIEAGDEARLAWEHLSKSGFITGRFTCAAADSADTTPVNSYGIYLQVVYDGIYGAGTSGTPAPPRHNVKTGAQIPVELIAEMDRKIDDGMPNAGAFQFSRYQGNAAAAPTDNSTTAPACTSASTLVGIWNTTNGSSNCGAASLL
ncbi:MAG: prepilin-type N-terminal cleavage/methylation domain-containing protein [Betaproteobacteria bacterium]|nr:MAG: prepilin-type N-terminal cleavage/methylation domain-containing protein [Betaproteobacteria bacterium]